MTLEDREREGAVVEDGVDGVRSVRMKEREVVEMLEG